MSELHSRLREATKTAHRELDHHPLLLPLIRDGLTEKVYGNCLLALHGVYGPMENAVCAAAVLAGFDYRLRLKGPAIEADLAELGRPPLARVACVPTPHSLGALIGMLYTLEGSTLGAQAICRQLSTGPCANLPMRYFSGYGEQTMTNWQSFWKFAEASYHAGVGEDACESAVATFCIIKQHLDVVCAELLAGKSSLIRPYTH